MTVAMTRRAPVAVPRDGLRSLEHRLDNACRLRKGDIDHGLIWFEEGRFSSIRHDCTRCGRPKCRRWVGVFYEFQIAPGVMPYAIVTTRPTCAVCTVARQAAEENTPIWRPKGVRR